MINDLELNCLRAYERAYDCFFTEECQGIFVGRGALSLAAQLEPIVELTGRADPLIRIQYFNNTATILARLGRLSDAVHYFRAAAQSPLALTYMSDIESTALEIKERLGRAR
jgi:hypothetical protein